jgi:hypothetical protein
MQQVHIYIYYTYISGKSGIYEIDLVIEITGPVGTVFKDRAVFAPHSLEDSLEVVERMLHKAYAATFNTFIVLPVSALLSFGVDLISAVNNVKTVSTFEAHLKKYKVKTLILY